MQDLSIRKACKQVLRGEVRKLVICNYDFSVHTGAAGIVKLGCHIPAHATVVQIRTVELTAVAGAGTLTFKANTTALTGALAVAAFTGVDIHALTGEPDGIKVAAKSEIRLTIGAGDLSAGHLDIFVEYLEGNPAD